MSNKIKIGIIGFGGFGNFIFKALAHSDQFLITAIADQFLKEEEIPAEVEFHREWNELLKRKGIDAVVISTPPSSHAEITIASLKEGKHVMTEKPLAITTESGKKVKEAALSYNRIVMVDFLQRFNPILEILQKLHQQNMFGDFERFYVENYAQDETLPPSHWFWDQNISGGILIEHAVHFIDIVHWFQSDEIEHISGFCNQRNATQSDRINANVHYKGGLMASHYHSFTRPDIFERTNMKFVFNTAQFDINGWIPESGTFTLLGNDRTLDKLRELPNMVLLEKSEIANKKVRGHEFDYTHLMTGTFASSQPKQELYALAVKNIFHDFFLNIKNKNHNPRVTLDDAIKAVKVAEIATQRASITRKH